MSLDNSLVLLVGATGILGQKILLETLRRKENFQNLRIRALVRDEARARKIFASIGVQDDDVEVVVGNVADKDSMVSAVRGVTHILFSASSSLWAKPGEPKAISYIGIRNLAELASAHDVQQFVYCSTQGSRQERSAVSRILNMLSRNTATWKGVGERAIMTASITVPFTVLRPGHIVKQAKKSNSWIKIEQINDFTKIGTTYDDCAFLMVEVLLHPSTKNTVFEFKTVVGSSSNPEAVDEQLKALKTTPRESEDELASAVEFADKKDRKNIICSNLCC